MTAQAGTIQNTRQLRKSAKGNRVFIRMLLVILQAMTSAVVFSFVFLFEGRISPLFLVFALLAATGLVAGLTSRRVLKTDIRLLQYLVGLISLFAALFALNYFSGGVLGINYLTIYQADFEPLAFIQVGIGIFSMWLAIAAWRKPKSHEFEDDISEAPYTAPPRARQVETNSPAVLERVRTPRPKRKINWFSASASSANNNSRNHSSSSAIPRERISLKGNKKSKRRVSKIRTRRSTLLLNRQQPVKFVGAEEHRCPYCLETVAYNDPRGVEICPVCQTHHHADCWEVTGVCQVPHANG
ncbi:MAG: hypothetical protein ABFS17_10390 [Chloroflexota bacterium]